MVNKLLGQLAYLEVTTPDVAASEAFYVERFGLRVVERTNGKVYLRCWGDYYRHSLVLTPGDDASLAAMAWRTESEEALHELVERIESAGSAGVWEEPAAGVGPAYTFTGPYGHVMTVFWEIENYIADAEFASVYPDRPEKRSDHAAAPRFLDHVTVAARDVEGFAQWYSSTLGFRIMGRTYLDEAPVNFFSVLTTNEKSHDLGVLLDSSEVAGRVHHIAFWVDHPEDLIRTADLMLENGTPIESGPSVHGIGEQNFLYFREPSTLRVEVNSGGYRNYVPDWQPKTWTPSLGSVNFFRNGAPPRSMLEAFPAAAGMTATEDGVSPDHLDVLLNSSLTEQSIDAHH